MIKVAINGFGRIGRMVFKAGIDDKEIEFVAINDLTDTQTLAHLLKYDTLQKKFEKEVEAKEKSLVVGGKEIPVFAEKDPSQLPWKKLDVDIAVESTGIFRTKEGAEKHLQGGAQKVLVSAPFKGETDPKTMFNIVKGVNDQLYEAEKYDLISNCSCTTNCAAPIIKVILDNFGIKKGFFTTIHAYTASQNIVDGPHKDLRRARAAALNIVPTTTGAAKAVVEVIPELKEKLDAGALRVPVGVGSITDFNLETEKETSRKEINSLFKSVSENELKGVIEYNEEPLVSSDIIGNPHSAIFDSDFTNELGKNLVKVMAWYDNEWGYSCRMVDVLKLLLK